MGAMEMGQLFYHHGIHDRGIIYVNTEKGLLGVEMPGEDIWKNNLVRKCKMEQKTGN